MRPPLSVISCLLPLVFAAATFADAPPPANLRPDILYTHQGEFIQVKPMRPLTLERPCRAVCL